MRKVYRLDDGTYVAADDGGWLPGVFADEAAANAALVLAKTDYEALARLTVDEARGRRGSYRLITVAVLDAATDTDIEPELPLIVVRADDETVHVVESALRDPDCFLAARHHALDGDERLATAVTLALVEHSRGMDLLDQDE